MEHSPHLSDVINMLALLAAAVGSCALLAAKYVHESGLRRQQYLEDLADEPAPVSKTASAPAFALTTIAKHVLSQPLQHISAREWGFCATIHVSSSSCCAVLSCLGPTAQGGSGEARHAKF